MTAPIGYLGERSVKSVIAMSVYNVLSRVARTDCPASTVLDFLREKWDARGPLVPELDLSHVLEGASFLQSRGLVKIDGDQLRIPVRDPNGFGPPVWVSEVKR